MPSTIHYATYLLYIFVRGSGVRVYIYDLCFCLIVLTLLLGENQIKKLLSSVIFQLDHFIKLVHFIKLIHIMNLHNNQHPPAKSESTVGVFNLDLLLRRSKLPSTKGNSVK